MFLSTEFIQEPFVDLFLSTKYIQGPFVDLFLSTEHIQESFRDFFSSTEHIQEPFKDGVVNGRVRSMPNSFLPPSPQERAGVLVLGDAYNMRHPLTGGGMSVCLNDAVIWRELLRDIPDLTDHGAIIRALRLFHRRRKSNHSFVVNVLANALYELFAANNGKFAFVSS